VDTFRGMGWLFVLSESFPLPAWMAWCVYLRTHPSRATWLLIAISLALYFPLVIYFGGLRGARRYTVWSMFAAAGIVHFYVRRIPRYAVLLAFPLLILFMYVYAFYKDVGPEALNIFRGADYRKYLTDSTARTPEVLLLGDFSRCDMQAYTLYRLVQTPGDFHYARGRTYLGALALAIPASIWPDRPPTRLKWTTDLEYHAGWYESGSQRASRVYGLAGEAMLNFGPWVVPFVFVIPAIAVALVQLLTTGLSVSDTRLFVLPILIILCISLVLNDSDENLFGLVKYAAVPMLVIVLGSRIKRPEESPAPAPHPPQSTSTADTPAHTRPR
jgi:hypothetical protein